MVDWIRKVCPKCGKEVSMLRFRQRPVYCTKHGEDPEEMKRKVELED